ncbi:MAG: ABC transporter permease [Halapricum sp.]
MSYARYLARRALFAVLSVYLVLSVTFALINLTVWQKIENRLALARYNGASQAEIEQIRNAFVNSRHLDAPLYERYVKWLVDVTTLKWGHSFTYHQSVVAVLDGRIVTTLQYVVPGVLLAVVLGVVVGLFAALARDGVFDWSARLVGYGVLGVPVFVVIFYYQYLSGTGLAIVDGFRVVTPTLSKLQLASFTVAASLLAGQLRFSRTAALEQSGRAFVKMLRAKGATRLRLARHVLRNAAIPIVSLSFSEVIAVLMLNIYAIEDVLRIHGLAEASLTAARESDMALVIWTTMVIVLIGITGNFLQDVLYGYLDPRIRAD